MTRPLNTTAEVVADFDGDSHLATLVEGVIIPAIATLGLIGNTLAIKVHTFRDFTKLQRWPRLGLFLVESTF